MSTYPVSPRAAFVNWCQGHASIFTANATSIGLTAPQASAFATAVTTVAAGLIEQEQARSAYRNVTQTLDSDVEHLRDVAGNTIRLIRAFAGASSKPITVYDLAQIPAPATPSPVPPPGSPTDFRIQLQPMGALKLTWKCANPGRAGGVTYEIRRSADGGPYAFIATVGKRTFLDTSIPSGAGQVAYSVTAVRSTASGVPAPFTVRFGDGGSGGGGVFIQGVEGDARVERADEMAAGGHPAHGAGSSTVNGKAVRKTLPGASGARGKSRV